MQEDIFPTTQQASSGVGYLIVHVTTARGAIPLEGARVSVYRAGERDLSSENGDRVASLLSGRDGNTPSIPLETPPKENSESPGIKNPYALYRVSVSLEGYSGLIYDNIPIFEGITAIQPAILIPLPDRLRASGYKGDVNIYYEGSDAPNL